MEVGFGSGLNLPYYNENAVTKLFALEPNDQQDLSNNRVKASNLDIEFIGLPSEEIPLETASMDTVLITFTMCTIPDIEKAYWRCVEYSNQTDACYLLNMGNRPIYLFQGGKMDSMSLGGNVLGDVI